MATDSNDYKCNLDCPIKDERPYCCRNCREARAYYVTDANRHLWSDDDGFWSKNGCRLSRDQMPQECKEYDCRAYTFIVVKCWHHGKWNEFILNFQPGNVLSPNALMPDYHIESVIWSNGKNKIKL